MRMTDSWSDGMCGWVEWTDGTHKVVVWWSIDGAITSQQVPITSQHAANEEAKRLLTESEG